jgi:hypothetical protein
MSSNTLPAAARQLLAKSLDDTPITIDEALAACPSQSILGRGRNAEEMMRRLGASLPS